MDVSGGYFWFKALHIISVIAWMAGLLYLPRLFVYHTEAEVGSEQSETFKVMERRLMKAIMTPAMISSLVFGVLLIMAIGPVIWEAGWFHAKVACLVGMFIHHGFQAKWLKAFAEDRNTHAQKFYRFQNEVPTLLMIAIVIFAVVKPF